MGDARVVADIQGNRIVLESAYSDKDRVKTISGARWDKATSLWSVPLSWSSCKQLRSTFGDRLLIGEDLLKWAFDEYDGRVSVCMDLRNQTDADPDGLIPALYPFQRAGARFLIHSRSAILSDPVGAGKTIQSLAAMQAVDGLPALVICPSSVQIAWKREVEKWLPGTPVFIVEGSAAQRNKILQAAVTTSNAVVVVKWEVIRLHSRLAPYGSIALSATEKTPGLLNQIPFKVVVADEAHRMKDPKSKQTRATWAVAHGPTVQYRWALTGTPLTDAPDTMWPILHFVDPCEWPAKSQFIDRYCLHGFNPWGAIEVFGIKPEMGEEFYSIFDPRFRRMPKSVVLPQLPPIQRVRRYVDMGKAQAKAYSQMAQNLVALTPNGDMVIASNPISQLTRLVQYSSATCEIIEGEVRLTDPSNKLDQLMIDLDDYLSDGQGVVVFAQSRQLIEMAEARLEKAKIRYAVIKGGQTSDERQFSIDAFQNGQVDVILVVVAAGGTGITLTRSRIAIFLQRSWSQVEMIQAEGRVHRIGSERHENVVIVDYISNGTIEEHQLDVLEGKSDRLEEIVRDKETIRRMLEGK